MDVPGLGPGYLLGKRVLVLQRQGPSQESEHLGRLETRTQALSALQRPPSLMTHTCSRGSLIPGIPRTPHAASQFQLPVSKMPTQPLIVKISKKTKAHFQSLAQELRDPIVDLRRCWQVNGYIFQKTYLRWFQEPSMINYVPLAKEGNTCPN